MKLTATVLNNGYVKTKNNTLFLLPIRGTDKEGYPQVLIDASNVGGTSSFKRQSIKPYIGMNVEFITQDGKHGYNFIIINNDTSP